MSLSTSGQQSINPTTVDQFVLLGEQLRLDAAARGHRAFQLIECHQLSDVALFRQWFDALSEKQRLWLPKHTTADKSDQIQQLLGTEQQLVAFDATLGLDPRLLAASAGTLVAGGLFLLFCPPLDQWADTYDHEYGTSHSVFLQRLASQLKQHCIRLSYPWLWQIAPPSQLATPALPKTHKRLVEQNGILDQLQKHIATQQPRVLVIQADRGRGKSTLLARVLLSKQTPQKVTITALHQSATQVLQRHCDKQQHRVNYLPLQQALQQSHELLLVDEAATIPLKQLLLLASLSKQIVFATTVDGYEGAGRGFATRFAKQLDEQFAGWRKFQPNHPIRWQTGDGLETLLNSTLLLKSELPELPPTPIKPSNIDCRQLSPAQLINEPQLLEHTFAILARAHYQTTAMDLRHMLDSPGMTVWVALVGDLPCAAALVCAEGEIDSNLYTDIAHKKRRLKHQLLPQLLTQFTLSDNLLSERYHRIVRIAVSPKLQSMGIGSALVGHIIKHSETCVDAIGTSFGADEPTLGFWIKQGLSPVHLGYKRNPRSGLPAVCMLLALNQTTRPATQTAIKTAIKTAQTLLRANLQLLQRSSVKDPEEPSQYATLVNTILASSPKDLETSEPENNFALQNQLYAKGARNFLDSLAAIHSLIDPNTQPNNQSALILFNALTTGIMSDTGKAPRSQDRELAGLITQYLGNPQ